MISPSNHNSKNTTTFLSADKHPLNEHHDFVAEASLFHNIYDLGNEPILSVPDRIILDDGVSHVSPPTLNEDFTVKRDGAFVEGDAGIISPLIRFAF